MRHGKLIFLFSIGLVFTSGVVLKLTGGVGPCGPASNSALAGYLWIFGLPIGVIGSAVGIIIWLITTYRSATKSCDIAQAGTKAVAAKMDSANPSMAERFHRSGPWQCSKCGEVLEPQFDSCWKCGSRDDATKT